MFFSIWNSLKSFKAHKEIKHNITKMSSSEVIKHLAFFILKFPNY